MRAPVKQSNNNLHFHDLVSSGIKNVHKSVAEMHFKYENLHCSGLGVPLQRVKTFTFVQARTARNPV